MMTTDAGVLLILSRLHARVRCFTIHSAHFGNSESSETNMMLMLCHKSQAHIVRLPYGKRMLGTTVWCALHHAIFHIMQIFKSCSFAHHAIFCSMQIFTAQQCADACSAHLRLQPRCTPDHKQEPWHASGRLHSAPLTADWGQ